MDDLLDPPGSSPLVAAVDWLQGTLLGTVATTVAIIAVASVGYGMLTGRIDWRRGASIFLGCFIVLGASSIAAGIRSAAGAGEGTLSYEAPPAAPQPARPITLPALSPPSPGAADPYAGAAVPSH